MNLRRRFSRQPDVELLDERALDRARPAPSPQGRPAAPSGRPATSSGRAARPSGGAPPTSKPSQMQPGEDRWGYGVAALLIIAGVVFALVRPSPGTKPPSSLFPLLGSGLGAILAFVTFRYRNRFISGMLAVLGALLVDTAKPPTSLLALDYLVLVAPLVWAVWLTMRQSKAQRALAASQPRLTPEQRRAQREARKARKRGEAPPEAARPTPQASRRYTPPQQRQQRKSRKELAAAAAPEPPKEKRSKRRSAKS